MQTGPSWLESRRRRRSVLAERVDLVRTDGDSSFQKFSARTPKITVHQEAEPRNLPLASFRAGGMRILKKRRALALGLARAHRGRVVSQCEKRSSWQKKKKNVRSGSSMLAIWCTAGDTYPWARESKDGRSLAWTRMSPGARHLDPSTRRARSSPASRMDRVHLRSDTVPICT